MEKYSGREDTYKAHSTDPTETYYTGPCTENQQIHWKTSGLSQQNGIVGKGATTKTDDQNADPETHMV